MAGKIKEFFIKHEFRLVLLVGFVLVAVISFEGGYLQGKANQGGPIVIEKPAVASNIDQGKVSGAESISGTKNEETVAKDQNSPVDCPFVGSKNSKKVHTANCRWAKQIKPENRVCFKTLEQAVGQGREPDKTCIK